MATVFDPSISFDNEFFEFQTSADGLTAWVDTNSGLGYFLKANKTMTWNTGKFYWEIVWNADIHESQTGFCIPNADSNIDGNWRYTILSETNPVIRSRRPSTGSDGTTIGLGSEMLAAAGDTLMFALDTVNSKFWIGLNGTWYNSGDPGAGTGETQAVDSGYDYLPFVAFSLSGQSNQSSTIAPQTTTYSAPPGFTTLDLPPPDVALPTFSYSLNVLGTEQGLFTERYALNAKELRKGVLVDQWSLTADPVWTPVVTAVHYRLTLRDTGFPDLELPMSSFQSRVRQGRPSFLEVYVPGILDYLDDINDRIDGELVVEMGTRKTDGSISVIEIARGGLQDVRYDRGPTSSTGTLTGRKTQTFSTNKTIQISEVELVSNTSTNRIRCKVLNEVQPGDTIEAAGISFKVDLIQHIVSPQQAYMELSDG